jgi:CRISPR-associated endoribonuclease Cas6
LLNVDRTLQSLGRLRHTALRFECVARDTITCGDFPGSALRGGLLAGLFDVGCVVAERDCPTCEFLSTCSVPRLSGEATRQSPTSTPLYRVRGFAGDADLAAGATFEFAIDLFGAATELRTLVIAAIERFAERGFGRRRARFEIVSINDSAPRDGATIDAELRDRVASIPPDSVVLRCESPLRLTANGRTLGRFSCVPFVSSLLRRARLVMESGEGIALEVDAAELKRHAATLRVIRDDLSKQDQVRYSARQGRSMNLHGTKGDVVIAGELAPLAPWLAFGAIAGVGKGAAFGHGVISLHAPARVGAPAR